MTTPEAARPRGTYAKGVARRQEILDRAIEVFAQRGGQRTSLRAIAQEVGVTHAARFATLRTDMTDQVRALQASGALRRDVDPALVAALVIAASDGLQTQWLLDPAVDHEAGLALLDRLLAAPSE